MKLSIITINWNNREGLRNTMNNVLGQTARNQFEYVVVDGGAPDGSKEMIETEYAGLIDHWVSLPIKPIYPKMNLGVKMSSGDYCLFLNSGDSFHGLDAIEQIIGQLHGEDIIIGQTIMLETGKKMAAHKPITLLSLYDHSIPHNAAFIKRELLVEHPYDEDLLITSDWKFFVESLILSNCSYRTVDNVIAEFDCNGLSSKNRDLCDKERESVFKEFFPDRVMLDYFRFTRGSAYIDSDYDRFYVKLRNYRSGKLLYTLNVLTMQFIALFKKSARWSKDYPIRFGRR